MSFESLKKAILDNADKQADEIKATWNKKVSQQEKRLGDKARELEEELINNANLEGEAAAKRLHQENQLAAKAKVLTTKQSQLAKLEEQLVDTILAWPEDKSSKLLENLLKQVPSKGGKITAGELHHNLLKKLVKKSGHDLLEKSIAKEGGFIWKSKDQEINVTVSSLVKQTLTTNRAKFAAILFS